MRRFLSHLHTDLRRTRATHRGATHAPDEVPMWQYKSYPRMKRVPLPDPVSQTMTLKHALNKRRSAISFDREPRELLTLTIDDIGSLFGMSLRMNQDSHRPYPSGGALYPIETYLFIESLAGHAAGTYHYHPAEHALEFLWSLPSAFTMNTLVSRSDHLDFSALIVFTSVWDRSSAKYGDFTYPLSLLEAGHMSQNIALSATAFDLAVCPIAGFDDDKISTFLDLDTAREQPVHAVTLGKYRCLRD